jgi:hypothetical protein
MIQDCPSHSGLLLILERIEANIAKIESGIAEINGRVRNTETEQATQKQRINGHDGDFKRISKRMSPGKAVTLGVAALVIVETVLRLWK